MTDWLRLFPNEDFRFQMGLHPGDAAAFFAPSDRGPAILDRRRAMLAVHPRRYAAALYDGLPLIEEAIVHISCWSGSRCSPESPHPLSHCIAAGRTYEPDWVLLSPDAPKSHLIVAGVVCFPSSWSLPKKIGLPMEEVHQPAPTVNSGLGQSISTFLHRLKPAESWERDNWGLSADDALDHHPEVETPPLTEEATLATTWLRLEHQILVRLPATQGILFGIRVTTHRLDTLAAIPSLGPRIAHALRTMPDDIAAYKGLVRCRTQLAGMLG